ncbi:MAG: NAD(P)-dependent oxidoreductase [Christensenellales bacterium]|jgi:putative dehydrogenase
MKKVGIIGIGDMGMGLAKNLMKAGFSVKGFDINPVRLQDFANEGGIACDHCAQVAIDTDSIFIMVMNSAQAEDVIFGENGLSDHLKAGQTIILTATIGKTPVEQLYKKLQPLGVEMIDSGVSGGQFGAEAGTLAMMAAGKKAVFDDNYPLLQAVGKDIFHVGEEPGMGQVVKSCMQVVVGCEFAAIFESLALGAKCGIDPEVLAGVINSSVAASPLIKNAAQKILDRTFEGTGSAITTYYKDVCITMDMAKDCGMPMFVTSEVQQLFQAGITKFPKEDNWAAVKLYEYITGAEVQRVKK